MKAIAFGGGGMTGCYLPESIPNYDLSDGYDITNLKTLEAIFEKERPDAVLNLAAVTDVVGSEKEYLHCYEVNTIGAYFVARMCKKYHARLCFISSVDVFDGEKESPYDPWDKRNPIVEYGHSKAAAENLILSVLPSALILRAAWMFGGGEKDKKFVSYIVKQIKENKPEIKAVNDTVGSATYGKDLIKLALVHMEADTSGIYHACNEGITTRYDEAVLIADTLGYKGKVTPVSSADFPKFRALKNASMNQSFNLRSWQEALKEYIEENYV